MPGFILLAFGVSISVAVLSNHLSKKRYKQRFLFWQDTPEPVEVKIEAYGMGRMAAEYGEDSDIRIPCDILNDLGKRYQMDTEELMRPFITELLPERRERDSK